MPVLTFHLTEDDSYILHFNLCLLNYCVFTFLTMFYHNKTKILDSCFDFNYKETGFQRG